MFDKIEKFLKELKKILPLLTEVLLGIGTIISVIKMIIDSLK